MRLPSFGRKSRPPQAVSARLPGLFPELARSTWNNNTGPTRSYEAQVRDAYLRNPIAQRAVRIIAEGAAGAPVRSTPPDHPVLALLGGGEPGPSLIETVAANLLLHGNAYVEVGLGAGGLPVALYSLRPERVTVEADSSGWPVGQAAATQNVDGLIVRLVAGVHNGTGTSSVGAGITNVATWVIIEGDPADSNPRANVILRSPASANSGWRVNRAFHRNLSIEAKTNAVAAATNSRIDNVEVRGVSGSEATTGVPLGGSGGILYATIRGTLAAAQQAYLDWLGGRLGAATIALRDAVRGVAPTVTSYLLFYAPQVLRTDAPDLPRANLPAAWAAPAFDVLQLEDYDFVTTGNVAGQDAARAVVTARLGYLSDRQHYFAGFVLRPADGVAWPLIADAATASIARGTAETFVWAWPQVARDGFVAFEIQGYETMAAFHDVQFPLAIGLRASGGPEFATQVATSSSGYEQRNAGWSNARLHFDAGIGLRSDDDLRTLLGFFRARRGQANGFRFTDPFDDSSRDDGAVPTPVDQLLGTGDGVTTRFALVKAYGADAEPYLRRITRPQSGSVVVAVGGSVMTGWQPAEFGYVDFAAAPASGLAVTAGFMFDVPVRFAVDRIDVAQGGWRSGEAPSVPLIEIREAG